MVYNSSIYVLTDRHTDCFILSQTVNVAIAKMKVSKALTETTEMSEVIAIILMNIVLNNYIKEIIIYLTYMHSTYLQVTKLKYEHVADHVSAIQWNTGMQ